MRRGRYAAGLVGLDVEAVLARGLAGKVEDGLGLRILAVGARVARVVPDPLVVLDEGRVG